MKLMEKYVQASAELSCATVCDFGLVSVTWWDRVHTDSDRDSTPPA